MFWAWKPLRTKNIESHQDFTGSYKKVHYESVERHTSEYNCSCNGKNIYAAIILGGKSNIIDKKSLVLAIYGSRPV